jgi:hypothetical protein
MNWCQCHQTFYYIVTDSVLKSARVFFQIILIFLSVILLANYLNSTCVWSHLCLVTLVSGHTCIWSHLCLVTLVSFHTCVWSHLCLVTLVSGHSCVWSHLCMVTLVSGHTCVLSHLCLVTLQQCDQTSTLISTDKHSSLFCHW